MRIVDTDNATLTCGKLILFRKTIMGAYGWITPYAVHIPGTPLLVKRNEDKNDVQGVWCRFCCDNDTEYMV